MAIQEQNIVYLKTQVMDDVPEGGGAANVTFLPAAPVPQQAHTLAHTITAENRRLNWIDTLDPLPAPGTVSLSYRAQGNNYRLSGTGSGTLPGGAGAAALPSSSGTSARTYNLNLMGANGRTLPATTTADPSSFLDEIERARARSLS